MQAVGKAPLLSSIVLSDDVRPAPVTAAAKPGEDVNPLTYRNVVIAPSAGRTFTHEGTLTFFFHLHQGTDDIPSLDAYVYRLTLRRESGLFYRSDFAPLSGTAERITNGMKLALQLPLSKLDPGSYEGEIEIALPDGRNTIARPVSSHVQ